MTYVDITKCIAVAFILIGFLILRILRYRKKWRVEARKERG